MEAEIQPPCAETRTAIVKRKAFLRATPISDEVAQFIADSITSNIRELEGALIKVLGLATIGKRPIDLDLACEALEDRTSRRSIKVTLDSVMGLITRETSVSAKDILGKGRTQAISLPRQIAMFMGREFTDHSLEEIGRYFGNRDHTTVLYAVGKIKNRASQDRAFRIYLDDLCRRLMSGRRP
jgi:chromosomal replication initiator protein